MEWTWFKDWWRLKNLRSRHQRHKKKLEAAAASAGTSATAAAVLSDSECVESACPKGAHSSRRHSLDAVQLIFGRRRTPGRDRRRRNRLLQRQRRSLSAGAGSQPGPFNPLHKSQNDDAGEYGPFNGSTYKDFGSSHGSDEDSDDFCFCDVCMNGDTDFGDSNDGMDSDTSTSSSNSKQVVVGICAMAKKTQSKPMKEILTRLGEFEFIKLVTFEENVILREPVQNWPTCDCLVSFHSKGFPLEKAIEYAQLRNPFVLNNLHMQYDIQDRRRVYAILEKEGIEIPRYAVLDRDSPDPKHHELIESEDHVEVNGITFNKPFVEKPVSAEDHNIYIYYPTSAGGGSQRLFRKIGSRSSVYSPESRVRKTGSFIYEDFMPTDVYFSGTDVKVYTVGPDYAHAEARKSPALDGKVERDSEGKEIRYPVILNHSEKLISRKVCLAFKQTVCGFDLLRANGKSYVCDVNGFSFVKNSNKYYDDCAKILGNMILRELTPTLHIPWSVPFQLDDPPIVPTTFGKMMELRCVVAVIRHGDRTPKQKMKVEVRHPKFFEIFEKYDGYKLGHVKLKRPKQLQEILDIARFLLSEIHTKAHAEIEEKESKLEQLKNVLEMYGHFSGINRKVQMKYQPKGRPRGSSSDDTNPAADQPVEPSLVLILKWGGELTPAGRIQAEELGRIFRCMYPGGQGRSDYSGTQGLGLLRLHSTFRHDLKIYASDEGRVQMTAAAFAKGLLALEGELTPILVQMVKSANTNGLLDNDCDSSKYQNLAKGRLHELMQNDREFSKEDREQINPCNSKSITQALDFVKNPVDCCHHVHLLIRELLHIISIKKDDPKTKDAILYHGETWDLMRCRWEKIEKDFSTKSKLFDISKIPDIYDCIKYDLQHNQHTLQYDQAEELYIYAKNLADIVIPQEYGLTPQEKLAIGQGICSPLLRKIKGDLQRNIDEVEDEFMNRLNPHYSHGVASPQRHVRTRLYFTSESHVHSLLTVLRYGGLLNVVTDEQWRRAMDYISMVSELNYMSQIVIMLYEDPTKDPTSEERFHVELHFSPGVNCCVQKNLPPGPGFRPHSHGDNACNVSLQSSDESNPARIEEENDSNSGEEREGKKRVTTGQRSTDRNAERTSPAFGFNRLELRSKQFKSKPIPIGAHHTVSGHEAMDLAKRLNEELASQQQQSQQLRPISPDIRAVSPDCEPRSRSFEQRPSSGVCAKEPASTLRLCQDMDKASSSASSSAQRKATSSSCGQLSMPASAPVLTDNPFRFTVSSVGAAASSSGSFVSCFEPIKEQVTPTGEVWEVPSQPEPHVVYNLPTLLITDTAVTTKSTSIKSSNATTLKSVDTTIESEISKGILIPKDVEIETVTVTTFAPTTIATDIRADTKTNITDTMKDESTTTQVSPTVTPTDTVTDLTKGIRNPTPTATRTSPASFTPSTATTTTSAAAAALFDNTATMSSNKPFTNQFQSIDPTPNDAPHHHVHQHPNLTTIADQQQHQTPRITQNTLIETNNTATNTNTTTTTLSCCTNTIATDSQVSVSVSASVSSANSSSSSRRQRHSIAGQMSYMKMLGFGGFSKKMATSANSLFSTAVISGSSSAPNLRDMIPVSSSGFGDVPPIRPLETLHNALSLRKLDSFLQDMILAQIFKTPTGSPPRGFAKSTLPAVSSMTLTASNQPGVTISNEAQIGGQQRPVTPTFDRRGSESGATDAHLRLLPECQCPNLDDSNSELLQSLAEKKHLYPQDSLQAAEDCEEASLPELETKPSLDLTMEIMEQWEAVPPSFEPMNQDSLESGEGAVGGGVFLSVCEEHGSGSTCLTPVSFGMDLDLSMVANKGSMSLSMDGFEDDEDATLSAATTPSLPADCEPRLESCYCCPTHAEGPPEVASDDPRFGFALPVRITQASPEHLRPVRRAHDTVSPKIQKQVSLFEGNVAQAAVQEKCDQTGSVGGGPILHASINLPAAGTHHLRQDARLRKFENLTQSTSNSNFPFESNTLKRTPMQATDDYDNVSHTQSCTDLKSGSGAVLGGSPQHQRGGGSEVPTEREPPRAYYGRMMNACCSTSASPSPSSSPSPGALIVKERFIEPPKRGVVRGYHGKTQSMDADFLFNEFLLLPAMAPAKLSFDSSDIDQASYEEAPSTSKQRHS
ncbi:inositol hexakisphosphate and diphosphoinositol-pentakisphosphate kinase isoform X9 [Drosophila biarmipes]|uniref:inositol hexakisphosphate and diphosphoinositol-pentakisphosphate kinase isoform X9 n=1 Tax=Drosophila biarmipes TaxID=125945 RepID=UPI0007E5D72C|nr:inositol hexakisphosphate and diphosphoinositol-pentakisphosphate kinase isoform X9 [Drosophila biarmipes]